MNNSDFAIAQVRQISLPDHSVSWQLQLVAAALSSTERFLMWSQFRFLRQLMLVHGRYTYLKMSYFSYYMFYKYNVLAMALLFFTFTAQASANRLFIQARSCCDCPRVLLE